MAITSNGDIRKAMADDGIPLEYEVLGDGPPLAMLHGGLVGRSTYDYQRPALAEQHRLILPSARGQDGTPLVMPADYGFATSEVRDLAAVLDATGVERCHVLGHSSGGAWAYAFARACPERVDRLILIEPTLLGVLPPKDLDKIKPGIERTLAAGKEHGDEAALRAVMDFLGGDKWLALDETVMARRLSAMAAMAPTVVPSWQILLALQVDAADLADLAPPTLLLYGAETYPFHRAIARQWRRHRPDLSLLDIEGASHNSHRQRPDLVNRLILDFLDG